MNETTLARELIDRRCGNHSLGSVYEFLLRVCHDSHEAEADFVKFISGELPQRLLEGPLVGGGGTNVHTERSNAQH